MSTERTFQQKVDLPAILGQFLTNSRAEDLVVELAQNEIDAGSSRTVIAFTAQALICEGDGESVDEVGWERLDMVLGAGGSVPAKADGIGVKNHGLRTGFKFGDDIVVHSGGWRMELTLCRDARKRRFDPGSWSRVRDPSGPATGTRITIPFRTRPLNVPSGEGFVLPVLSTEKLHSLFEEAAAEAPARFLSAISATRALYRLELRWGTSERRLFEFDRVPARVPDWPGLARRTCRQVSEDGSSKVLIREAVATFAIKLSAGDHGRVPRLFRSGRQLRGELSWNLDERGRPAAGVGKLRYPIGYPDGDFDAYSGHGFHISAPFVSDTTRHGLAADSERNRLLLDQAGTTMVDLLRTNLLPKYGPSALTLLRRPDRPDIERERSISIALLTKGALLVNHRTEAGTLGVPRLLKPGASLTVVSFADMPSRVARELFSLAPTAARLLDERTPAFIVDALCQIGSDCVKVWSDQDAVLGLVPATETEKDRRLKQPMDAARIATATKTLEIAQRAIDRQSLPKDLVPRLHDEGLLPVAAGYERAWRSVYFSAEPVPTIDGVQTPATVHPKLTHLRFLKAGPLQLSRFRLDDYLSRLNFAPTGKAPRDSFFQWLAKRHETLKPSTLAKLSEFPFWPTRDGKHVALSEIVWPRSDKLRHMLVDVVPQPSLALQRFPALRRSARGVLYLRPWPTQSELQLWYDQTAERIDEAEAADDAPKLRRELAALEECLAYLAEESYLCELVPVIAVDHRTLSMRGERAPVKVLHLSTPSVEASCLLQADLIAGPHHPLYELLGAQQRPSAEALLRALQEDVAGGERLFRRLEAFDSAASLAELEGCRIIPLGDEVLRPIDLALPLQADLWGGWKRSWSSPDISPDRSALLVRMGVAKVLTEVLSAEFFRWLSTQQLAVQAAHLSQIHRHLRDRQRGPLKWWSGEPHLPCLPTRGPDDLFELVSYSRAINKRGPVFLPDFPELQDQVLERDRLKRLVITDVEGLSGTLFTPLRLAHVKSLRRSFGRPVALTASGEVRSADPPLEDVLTKLRSERMIGELPQRLELHGLSQDTLRGSWRAHARALRSVRIAPELRARFTFSGKIYEAPYSSGVDAATGLVWLSRGRDPFMLLYEALASFLFEDGMNPLTPYGLMRAVEMPFASAGRASDVPGAAEESLEEEEPAPTHGAGERGHGLTEADLRPAVPNPTPFSKDPIPKPSSGALPRGHKRPRPAASTAGLRGTVLELEQTRQLKEDHYGFHCQACLGLHDVQDVTPPQTYLALPKYRRVLVEAHHVDHLQNEGALGAANLIALCKYHHDLLGDRLTGAMIRTGLETATPLLRRFPGAREGTFKELEGLGVTILLDVSPFNAKLFFTTEHAAAWGK